MVHVLMLAILITGLSGVPGLFFPRESPLGERVSAVLLGSGCLLGLVSAFACLRPGAAASLEGSWPVPGGAFALQVDALSTVFLAQIFLLSLLGSAYGLEYWSHADHPRSGPALRCFWGGLTAALALVVTSQNTILFLASWEVMALCNFLALTVEHRHSAEVRRAGLIYIVATHTSTLALFGMFAVLHAATGGFSWTRLADSTVGSGTTTALFLLAVLGFGTKAGVMPLHVWLPPAHANAPTHVSALMSGVVIKMGIYGLFRVTSLVAHPPLWWGGLVLGLGMLSGVFGVALALGQHDLKRLLAYHSVENIGIICMGLGLALLGRAAERPELVALGFAGALFHVWNHGMFKSLLFLGAGSVIHCVGTREIDRLGGLSRKLPYTALLFFVGAAAICGLPPLNGFASEFLVYVGLFRAAAEKSGRLWVAGGLGAPALALVGALAVACFAKAFGVVFLGRERTEAAGRAHEAGPAMLGPMMVLAGVCLLLGVAPAVVAPLLDSAIHVWVSGGSAPSLLKVAQLNSLSVVGFFLLAAVSVLGLWLYLRTRRAVPGNVGTWDCGYAAGTARIQYTASSFADSLLRLFAWALRPHVRVQKLAGPFPQGAAFHSETPDVVLDFALVPAIDATGRAFSWLRWIQRGSVQAYLLYILLTLIVLMLCR